MTFKVQRHRCKTCIYRKDSRLNLKQLEAQIEDPRMHAYFIGYRECHHAKSGSKVCCRGFWDHHKNKFTLGQIAQRLDLVEYVDIDVL